MNNHFKVLKSKFMEIKGRGWIKSFRFGATGIGYTFEKLLGKEEDARCLPDFNGIEIKTHRKNSKSYVTLFNYNPVGESSYELKRLFNCYSYVHSRFRKIRVLNVCAYCNYIIDVGVKYKFSLEVDDDNRRVYLLVFDRSGILIERKAYWSFETLREKLYSKLQFLAYVEAESKYIGGIEYFKYSSIKFYILKDFGAFIMLIKTAKVKVSFFISGVVGDDGYINTHGTSFSIKNENLSLLFDFVE